MVICFSFWVVLFPYLFRFTHILFYFYFRFIRVGSERERPREGGLFFCLGDDGSDVSKTPHYHTHT